MSQTESPRSTDRRSLDGKVALVTGGSRGIGRAIALRLARQGADVAINFLNSESAAVETAEAIDSIGQRVMVLRADVSRSDDVAAMVGQIDSQWNRLDIVVSNAAAGGFRPLGDTAAVNLEATLRCNALPVVSLTASASELLTRGPERGKVIAVSSHGSRWAVPNYGAIGASKAALESYVRHLALEYGDRGINVNCVLPGIIATEAVATMPAVKQVIDAAQARMMVGDRHLRAEDVAGVVAFLASSDADLIQGQTVVVDGGVSIRV